MSLNTLNLKQKLGGRVIKQADKSSTFKFALQDSNGALINLNGQSASISLHNPNSRRYWETTASVKNSEVEFKLPGNLASDDYILEISCNGYVFPSDNDFIIEVVKGYKELLNKETAEATKLTFSEIRKQVENEAKEDLEKQIIKINGVKSNAISDLSKMKSQGLADIENAKSNSLSEIDTRKNKALSELKEKTNSELLSLDDKTQDGVDKLEAKAQDGLKKIGDKSKETLLTIDNKKTDTLQGLETTRKNFETNINNALTQAIKDIPYEKLKGDKGDRGEKGEAPLVFSSNPPDDKKVLWIKNDNVRNIYKELYETLSSAMYIGELNKMEEFPNAEEGMNIALYISGVKNFSANYIGVSNYKLKIIKSLQSTDSYIYIQISNEDMNILRNNTKVEISGKYDYIENDASQGVKKQVKWLRKTSEEKYLTLNVYNPTSNKWEKIKFYD